MGGARQRGVGKCRVGRRQLRARPSPPRPGNHVAFAESPLPGARPIRPSPVASPLSKFAFNAPKAPLGWQPQGDRGHICGVAVLTAQQGPSG